MVFLVAHTVGASGPMTLEEVLRSTGAVLRWDPWRHMGQLEKGDKTLIFRPGDTWIITNGKKLGVTGTILEEEGRLVFSEEAAGTVLRFFGVEDLAAAPYRLDTILIDAGHGGRDSGAWRSWEVDGIDYPIKEKDVVLEISLRLAERLRNAYPDKNILMTRTSDIYPTLEERVVKANDVVLGPREGMIYISIHANASLNPKAEGYEVWYLPEDYRRTVVDTGAVGNEVESIAPIVNALWEEEFTHESVRLADMILDGFRETLGTSVPDRGRREESWFVVRNARMASVLVEVGFITHREEAARMREPDYLRRLADGIYNGVTNFVEFFESRGR
jgi:N-acetylmuramoyl-L-alanine amidase